MNVKRVQLKLAASQEFWIQTSLTEQEYKNIFLLGSWGFFPVVYIWPVGSPVMYDCEAKQWLMAETKDPLNRNFIKAAARMTEQDRARIASLVRKCLATELDLGETE